MSKLKKDKIIEEKPLEKTQVNGEILVSSITEKKEINLNCEIVEDEIEAKSSNDTTDFEKLKLIYEFQYNSVKEASGILEKGISFFLLIIAALTSYVFSNKSELDLYLQLKLISGVIITTTLVTISLSFIAWGIFKGLQDIKVTLKTATGNVWKITKADEFINRGTKTTLFIGATGTILMLIILVFYITVYIDLNNVINKKETEKTSTNTENKTKNDNHK